MRLKKLSDTNLVTSRHIKGRYTRGVLLLEHAPGSFGTCQYTRGSVFKFAQFVKGACSQIFNLLNIVEHFVGWKFCSRGWSTPMKSLVHTQEVCSRSVPLEHAPGAKSLVCIGLKREKASLPVDVRCSKTPLLKLYLTTVARVAQLVQPLTAERVVGSIPGTEQIL